MFKHALHVTSPNSTDVMPSFPPTWCPSMQLEALFASDRHCDCCATIHLAKGANVPQQETQTYPISDCTGITTLGTFQGRNTQSAHPPCYNTRGKKQSAADCNTITNSRPDSADVQDKVHDVGRVLHERDTREKLIHKPWKRHASKVHCSKRPILCCASRRCIYNHHSYYTKHPSKHKSTACPCSMRQHATPHGSLTSGTG